MIVIVISTAPLDTSHDAEWTTLAKLIYLLACYPITHFAGGVDTHDNVVQILQDSVGEEWPPLVWKCVNEKQPIQVNYSRRKTIFGFHKRIISVEVCRPNISTRISRKFIDASQYILTRALSSDPVKRQI